MKKFRLALIPIVAMALIVLSLSACEKPAPQEAVPPPAAPPVPQGPPGVTDTEIRLGTWAPMTGPASSYGVVAMAMEAYFQKINEEGGIHGRKIKLIVRDDGYQPSRTVTAVKELVEKDEVFAIVGGVGTATGMAVRDYLVEKNRIWVGPITGSQAWANPPSLLRFAVYPTYTAEAKQLVSYAVQNLKKKKFAIFYQNDAFGKEGLTSAKATALALGATVLMEVSHELSDTDLSSQALKVKRSGADTVILWSTPKFTANFVKECAKIRFKPQFLSTSTVSDPIMFKLAGKAWEGVILANWLPLVDADTPGVAYYREAIAAASQKLNPGNFTMVSFGSAEPMVEALRRAGRDLNNKSLLAALHSLKNYEGRFVHDLTYTPDDHQGVESVYFVQARNGKLVKISDWLTDQE